MRRGGLHCPPRLEASNLRHTYDETRFRNVTSGKVVCAAPGECGLGMAMFKPGFWLFFRAWEKAEGRVMLLSGIGLRIWFISKGSLLARSPVTSLSHLGALSRPVFRSFALHGETA